MDENVWGSNAGILSSALRHRVAKHVSAPMVPRTVGVLLIVQLDTDPEGVCV